MIPSWLVPPPWQHFPVNKTKCIEFLRAEVACVLLNAGKLVSLHPPSMKPKLVQVICDYVGLMKSKWMVANISSGVFALLGEPLLIMVVDFCSISINVQFGSERDCQY